MKRFLATAFLLVLFGSCADDTLTQIIVVVTPETMVRTQSTGVRVVVSSEPSTGAGQLLAEQSSAPWNDDGEYTISLVTRRTDARYRVEVDAISGTRVVSTSRLISGYVAGDTRYVRLLLSDVCAGISCDRDKTCVAGQCRSATLDPLTFPRETDEEPQSSADGGDVSAANRSDAETLDATTSAPTSGGTATPRYVLLSSITSTSYLTVLHSTGPQTIDPTKSLRFADFPNVWVHEGQVYVGTDDSLITRYDLLDDDSLVKRGTISFEEYGLRDNLTNTFVAPDKAYATGDVRFLYDDDAPFVVVWNPRTMAVMGTIPMPTIEARGKLDPQFGWVHQVPVTNGKLYQPIHWVNAYEIGVGYTYSADSRVAVIDVASNRLERMLDVPCLGLELGTVDGAGNVWLSGGSSTVRASVFNGASPNCAARIAPGSNAAVPAFRYTDITGGGEGALLYALGDNTLVMSVMYVVRDAQGAPTESANFQLWTYDTSTDAAKKLEGVDNLIGHLAAVRVDDKPFLLVPEGQFSSTSVYTVENGRAIRQFQTPSHATTLLRVR
jgi:hypothetical protein